MAAICTRLKSYLLRRDPFPFLPKWAFFLTFFAAALFVTLHVAMYRVTVAIHADANGSDQAIRQVAAAIAEMKPTAAERAALVGYAVEHLIEYDRSRKVYGPVLAPSLDDIFAKRREHHWLYPRGDCKTKAVVAGSILSALGIEWEPVANPVMAHAWVRVRLDGQAYDIMAGDPEFGWRPWERRMVAVSHWLGFTAPRPGPPLPDSHYLLAAPQSASLAFRFAYLRDSFLVGALYLDRGVTKVHLPLNFDQPTARLPWLEKDRASAQLAGFPFGELR